MVDRKQEISLMPEKTYTYVITGGGLAGGSAIQGIRELDKRGSILLISIKADGVGVMIEARHLRMMMRGVEKQNSMMMTSALLGVFRRNPATRQEFLSLVSRPTV